MIVHLDGGEKDPARGEAVRNPGAADLAVAAAETGVGAGAGYILDQEIGRALRRVRKGDENCLLSQSKWSPGAGPSSGTSRESP